MKNIFAAAAISVFIMLSFSACSGKGSAAKLNAANEQHLTDALGRDYAFTGPAERIVSLVPAVTEILFAIGADDKVAAVTDYCNYPPETAQRVRIGGFAGITVDMETIADLKPDLIFISADMHGRTASLLDGLKLPYFAVEPRNLDDIYACIDTIGKLTGCRAGAGKAAAEMQAKIAEAQALADGARPNVYWELAADPLISAGRGSFVGEAIRLAGGNNVFGGLEQSWPQVSGEQVIAAAPDWILTGSDSAIGAAVAEAAGAAFPIVGDDKLTAYYAGRPGWQAVPAVEKGRVAVLDADTLYRYGPRFADAILALAKLLHHLQQFQIQKE